MNDIKIIGEIGINHSGDMDLCKRTIDLAIDCGCDMVKFQKRTIDRVYDAQTLEIPRESVWGLTTREQKEGLEFGENDYDEIDEYCKEKGIDWFFSAWDVGSQVLMRKYNVKYNKIASPLITHDKLLHEVASENKHTFISTGMSTLEEVDHAVDIFRQHNTKFTIMACVSTYPCQANECNVRTVQTLKYRYPDSIGVGYSSHEKGILASLLAVSLGAHYIERHITVDRSLLGSDMAASLGPDGLRRLCRDARVVNDMLGDGNKFVLPSEVPIKDKLRRY